MWNIENSIKLNYVWLANLVNYLENNYGCVIYDNNGVLCKDGYILNNYGTQLICV